MAKSIILRYLVYLLMISAAMPAWQYNFGVRMMASDLIGLIFVGAFFFIKIMTNQLKLTFTPNISEFILFLVGLYLLQVVSFFGLISYGLSYPEFVDGAINQLLIGLVRNFFLLTLFIVLASYLCQLPAHKRHKIIMVFIYTIVASCIYQMLTLYMLIFNGINLDEIIWPAISYGITEDMSSVQSGIIGWDFGNFFRAGGFIINPNSLAAQIVCVIPLFIFLFIGTHKKIYLISSLICLVSLAFTISRSGFLAFGLAVLVALVFNYKEIFQKKTKDKKK